MNRALEGPKTWLSQLGEMAKFAGRDFGEVFSGKVFKYTGEVLRQCGVLVLGSALTIWTLMFILGLTCGIEGAYFNRSTGAPAYAGEPTERLKYAPSMPHCRPMMKIRPQITIVELRIRMPAWRSASPKKRRTRRPNTSPTTREQNLTISPKLASQSLGTLSQPI